MPLVCDVVTKRVLYGKATISGVFPAIENVGGDSIMFFADDYQSREFCSIWTEQK